MQIETKMRNASAFEFCQSAAPQVAALCEPFFNAFGLTTFIYGRGFNDGRYLLLTNQTKWAKNWFQNVHTIVDTAFYMSLRNAPLKQPVYGLWSTVPHDKLIQMHNSFGIWHGFDIHYRLEDSVEVWSFGTSADREQINYFYFNNLKVFHRFCLFFRNKAADFLRIEDSKKLGIHKEKFDLSFSPSRSQAEDLKLLFSYFPLERYSLKINNTQTRLSKREIECLWHLSHGKTAKEIGRLLDISSRTVESYITTLKYKTGFNSKSLLVDSFRDNLLKWLD